MEDKLKDIEKVLRVLEKASFSGLSVTDMYEMVNITNKFSKAVNDLKKQVEGNPVEAKTKLEVPKKA